MNELCRFLPWDSNFFGLNIARVVPSRLDYVSISLINQWCIQNDIDCLYFLADPEYRETTRIAEENQFHLVDVRVTMNHQQRPPSPAKHGPSPLLIRPFRVSDLDELQIIARDSFTRSRFYSDPCFPRDKCDELYEIWIKNSCEGYADHVLVADNNGIPQGFITCHIRKNNGEGDIGLVGVCEQARGQGVGRSLVETALKWFQKQGIVQTFVVTQGSNIPASKLYENTGFSIHLLQLWYHKWFKGCPDNTRDE